MTYVGLHGSYVAIAIGLIVLGAIGMTVGIGLIFNSESSDRAVKDGFILLICSILICVSGIILSAKPRYEIKIDKSVTVKELTDTFIIHDYNVTDDIWVVSQKKGGLDPQDLEESNEES